VSENLCIDITKGSTNHLHPIVNYPIKDMITTFKEFTKHWPTSLPIDEVDLLTPFFLQAKPK
jgi:hypothetical protein